MAVWAEQFPALYDVTGVASNDVLNIRAAPNASGQLLDSFDPFETNIEVVGTDASGRWGRVRAGEAMGWSSLRFLRRQAGQDTGLLPDRLWCAGTEPFWTLDFEGFGTTTLDQFGEVSRYRMEPLEMAAATPIAHGTTGTGADGRIAMSVLHTQCSDGMSDIEFGLATVLIMEQRFGTEVLYGCCSLR